jgi:hypothetical protein
VVARFAGASGLFTAEDLFFAPEAVGLSFEHDDLRMVDESIDDRTGGGGVPKHCMMPRVSID